MADLVLPPPLPTGSAANQITAGALAESTNAHRAGLLDLERRVNEGTLTNGERIQNLERRVEETKNELRAAKQTAAEAALSSHAGLPESEVVARYSTGSGFRLSAVKRTIKVPSGGTTDVVAFGYLDDPKPVNAEQVEAQRAYRALALAGSIFKRKGDMAGPMVDAAYRNLFTVLAQTPTASRATAVRAILDGSAGAGAELLPVPTLSAIRSPMRLQRRLAGLIEVETHDQESWKEISEVGNFLMRKRGARTDDPARYERQKFTTSDTTAAAYSYTGQTLIDDNLIQSPSAVVSITDRAMAFLDRMEADTMEVQLLHSDTAATHQDSAYESWTVGSYFTAGELGGSDSPIRQWIGWRATAFDDSCDASAGGSFDETDWFGTIKLMGNRAVSDLVAGIGIAAYFAHILPNAKFVSRDYTDRPTLVVGEVTDIGGVPLVLSEFLPSEFPSSGLYTTGGSTGQIVIGDRTGWRWDVVSALETDWEVTEQHRGAVYIGRKRTYRLTKRVVTGDKPNAVIRNL